MNLGPGTKPLDPAQVALVIPSIGDVDLTPILANFPPEIETVIWDNSQRPIDYKVFGRYMGILETSRPVVFTMDDDCVLSADQIAQLLDAYEPGVVVGNMIREDPLWRSRYHDMTLLGWGAVFDRDLPWKALMRYARYYPIDLEFMLGVGGAEIVFPMLSRCRTIVAGATWLGEPGHEVFGRANRMSNRPGFIDERLFWLERAREVRDRLKRDERG